MKFQIGDLLIRTDKTPYGTQTTSINVITKTDVRYNSSYCVLTKDFTTNKQQQHYTDWLIGDIGIGKVKYYPVVKQ